MIYVSVNVGIVRCQVRTHPPSDGLHFIVMDANKGPAPELTLSQNFGFEHEDIPNPVLNFVSMPEDFNMQNSQPPYSSCWTSPATAQNQSVQRRDFVPEPVHEIQETRIVDSDLEGQNPTTLPFPDGTIGNFWTTKQLPLASGPAELPSYAMDHGFGFTDEDSPITGWPNLQQLWSGENIGELDFLLVAKGPGMQNPQLHYSGDGKIYRSPQLHAFSKTSGILSISSDFPHVLEEDISILRLPNPQLPNSVPWPVLETQETRIVGSDLEGQKPTALPFPDGTIGNFWTTKQLLLASGPAELPSYATDHGFGFTVEDIPITGWPNLQHPWSGENIGELDFLLVAEGPGMQNPQLHYSGDGKIYRSPQLHAFSKTSGILSISKGDFPHVLEEDISIPRLPNPQLPNSVPWAVLETQETRIVSSDLEGQKPTTNEQDKLTQPSLGNYAGNTSQPLPRLPDHEETYNHEVLPSPPCEKAELSSSKGKGRTYKKFSFEEMEKLIEGVEKYGRKYCNWKTIKNLYFEDSDRSKDQLKEKWRHMKKSANKQTDPHLKKLYVRALKVQMSPPKSKSSKCKLEKLPNYNLENQ